MANAAAPIDRAELIKHLDGVRRLARRLVSDDTEADDVLQDTAVAALENQQPVRRGLGAWLSGVTKNIVHNRRRAETRRTRREQAVARAETTPSVAESVVRAAEQSRLLDLLLGMDDPYRTALLLRFVDGLPPRVIATRLGQPVETVRTHVKRGLAELRVRLDRRHGGREMWRAPLGLVAAGASTAPALSGRMAFGKKVLGAAALLAAVVVASWWVWQLAREDEQGGEVALEVAETALATAETPPQAKPEPRRIVLRDEPRTRPDLRAAKPPPEVIEPEPRPSAPASPVPDPVPTRVRPVAPVQVPPPPTLHPRRVYPGRSGRLLRDRTGGRAELPAAHVWIGTPARWVDGITAARRGTAPAAFAYEAPRHIVEVGAFAIDLYEVSNAQYRRYLQQQGEYRFRVGREVHGTLEQIARTVVTQHVPTNLDWDRVARQLFETNQGVLLDRFRSAVVEDASGVVDLERTWARLRELTIHPGMSLRFADRAPPPDWPSLVFPTGEAARPVRGVSYEEAQGFAHWAGKHLPTEIEWEYASRGAKGSAYPWGGKPTRWRTRVNGGVSFARGAGPETVDFDALPDGQSPFGLFHTLGNVAEYTSSFLGPYPGSGLPPIPGPNGPLMVVRGGSALDQDSLLVRPAFRGWGRSALDAPGGAALERMPEARKRLPWTGFRCAVYAEPARSRLPELNWIAAVDGVLPDDALARATYAGTEHKTLIPPGATVENGIFVNQKAWSFVAVALRRLALPSGGTPAYTLDATHAITDTETLLEAGTGTVPILLGMLQTDTALPGLHAPRGGRVGASVERLLAVTAPAGAYFVALLQGRLALVTPNLAFAYYVTPRPVTRATVSVLKRSIPTGDRSGAQASLTLDVRAARLGVSLELPLGTGALAGRVVRVRLAVAVDSRVVQNVGVFESYAGR